MDYATLAPNAANPHALNALLREQPARATDQINDRIQRLDTTLSEAVKLLYEMADRLIGSEPETAGGASAREVRSGSTGSLLDGLDVCQHRATNALAIIQRLEQRL